MRMKNQRALSQRLHKQAGLTLLEIMITVVILSLGLLGLAGLQMTGLKNNRNAYYNTVAAQVVQDLAERIKADQVGANDEKYDALDEVADQSKCAVADPTVLERAACLAAALPGGRSLVTKRSDIPKTFYVAMRWTDLELPTDGHGWRDADADDVAACDTPTDASNKNVNCYYNVVMP